MIVLQLFHQQGQTSGSAIWDDNWAETSVIILLKCSHNHCTFFNEEGPSDPLVTDSHHITSCLLKWLLLYYIMSLIFCLNWFGPRPKIKAWCKIILDHKVRRSSNAALLRKPELKFTSRALWAYYHCGFFQCPSAALLAFSSLFLISCCPLCYHTTPFFLSIQLFWPRVPTSFFLPLTMSNFDFCTLSLQISSIRILLILCWNCLSLCGLSQHCACVRMNAATEHHCWQFSSPHSLCISISHKHLETHIHTPVFLCPMAGQRCTVAYCRICVCVSDCSCFWPSRLPHRFQLHFPP